MAPITTTTTTTITNLPPEVLSFVTAYLPSPDLRNLRLTCRDIEHKTYSDFLHNGFKTKTLDLRTDSLPDFSDLVKKNPLLASSIQTLRLVGIDQVEKRLRSRVKRGGVWYWQSISQAGVAKPINLVELLAKLPKIRVLKLENVTTSSFRVLIPLEKPTDDPATATAAAAAVAVASLANISELHLTTISLHAQDLCNLFAALGTTRLQTISLTGILSTNGHWGKIFRAIKAMQLQGLEVKDLRSFPERKVFEMLGGGARVDKAMRGPMGIEQYWVSNGHARMAGGSAVTAGLDLILARCGAD